MRKFVIFGLLPSLALLLLLAGTPFYELSVAPRLGAKEFCKLWQERLCSVTNPDGLPPEWRNTVCVRRFDDGWVMAAMYHGSCTKSGSAAFNASVFRDCVGKVIVYPAYSPCAGGIDDIGRFWEDLSPAKSFAEYQAKYPNGPPKSG